MDILFHWFRSYFLGFCNYLIIIRFANQSLVYRLYQAHIFMVRFHGHAAVERIQTYEIFA
jgi:hypothetical protein